jgi:Tol biopolymer transport system component
METRGASAPVVNEVSTTGSGAVNAVIASNGTLAYVSGGASGAQRVLVWVDRQGRETPIPSVPRLYLLPRVSPDGSRLAVYSSDQEQDIWIWDLAQTTLTRATFNPTLENFPLWTPNGSRLIFSSDRTGARNLFWQPADGLGAVERLTESPNAQFPSAVSPDGQQLIFSELTPNRDEEVLQVTLDGSRRVTPLVQGPFAERNAVVSPDGRWLAYESNESGHFEISVRPYPRVDAGRWRVSTAGGTRPLWGPGGQELFYVAATGALMRVGVQRGGSWVATQSTLVLEEGDYLTNPGGRFGRNYDIARDGQRFLMIKELGTDRNTAASSLVVVLNWADELKRLVPSQ